jgi:hypothetical protein
MVPHWMGHAPSQHATISVWLTTGTLVAELRTILASS